MKLTGRQIYKLLQPTRITRDKVFWCHTIAMSTEPLTEEQYNTAVAITEMYVLEQAKYIILNDELILCPTNKQTHIIERKMARTDK